MCIDEFQKVWNDTDLLIDVYYITKVLNRLIRVVKSALKNIRINEMESKTPTIPYKFSSFKTAENNQYHAVFESFVSPQGHNCARC